jgi:diguanylate cyclase (GGDEF)-like protein/PAS domain S-box-containing protein
VARAEGILRLLIVDDSMSDADAIINSVRSAGHAVRATREQSLSGVENELRSRTFDLILCRDEVAGLLPADVIALTHSLVKDIPFIVITSNKNNLEALFEIGANDVVMFDDRERLQFAVGRELTHLFARRTARRNERALRESEKRSHALLESSRDAVAYMHEGMHIYVNSAYLALFGYDEIEDIDGLPFLDMVQVDDHAKFKASFRQFSEQNEEKLDEALAVQCVKADGSVFKAEIVFSHARVEGEDCTQVVVRDEVELLQDQMQSELLRDRDFVTGLYSRLHFMDELQQAIIKATAGEGDSEVVYLSIDNFVDLKEKVGLRATDLVMKTCAEALKANLTEHELVGYYADSVFALLMPTSSEQDTIQRIESLSHILTSSISELENIDFELRCSGGVCRVSEGVSTAFNALENAHSAYLKALQQNTTDVKVGRYSANDELELTLETSEKAASDWREKYQNAINNDEFYLHYQPIVGLHGEEQEAYEVLLRLDDEFGQPYNAQHLVAQAEEINLMGEIDRWVVRKALDKLAEHSKIHPKTRFFVKLSQQTISSQQFVDWLSASLDAHSLSGSALTFEISETAAVENVELTRTLINSLREIGCEFALEHFGSGIDFSRSLEEFELDYVKVNGNFVQSMSADSENLAVVKTIVDMSKQAGKACIAEFVSDANSLALLWQLGVDYAQGYYIHEPSENLDYVFEGVSA